MFTDKSVNPITFYKGRFKATSYLPLYKKFPTDVSLSVSMSFALLSANFIHVRDCWKNGFEHNKLTIFELKLKGVPRTLCSRSTWECVLLHEEMKIIF